MNVANQAQPNLLKRLAKDTTGNTLMLVAAATIPLAGMIGAGVDISRSYLVKSRLQAACDAGSLATRKFMNSTTLDSGTVAKGRAYFDNNFPKIPSSNPTTWSFGATDVTFDATLGDDNEVNGVAKARLPMTVMKIFNNQFTDISVKCDAKLDIGNTDVALVLDVTGSMATTLGSGTRISALKAAVINFYKTLGPGNDTRGRIRYAVVPYSTNVNLKTVLPNDAKIGGTGPDTWVYQTRVAKMDKPTYVGPSTDLGYEVYNGGASISKTDCGNYGKNAWPTNGGNPVVVNGPGTPPESKTSTLYSNNPNGGADWGYSGASDTNTGDNKASCRRKRVQSDLDLVYTFNGWLYKRASVDVGGYAAGDSVNVFTSNTTSLIKQSQVQGEYDLRELANDPNVTLTGGTSLVKWSGCIEERDTKSDIIATTPVTYDVEAQKAYDLDINTLPTDDATRWRPIWDELLYSRSTLDEATTGSKKDEYGCPGDPARRLMQYASLDSAPTGFSDFSSFRNYINNLVIGSGTMHDIGMVWGARILSGDGLFAADNPDTWAGQPVSRHLIFMTDGEMNAHEDEFVFHGNNQLDQRVAPRGTSKANIDKIHNRRLRIACEQARQQGIIVWVIAFADGKASDYPDLKACAYTEDQYVFAPTPEALDAEFQTIASKISALRLTH